MTMMSRSVARFFAGWEKEQGRKATLEDQGQILREYFAPIEPTDSAWRRNKFAEFEELFKKLEDM